jgi:hypothetical protein
MCAKTSRSVARVTAGVAEALCETFVCRLGHHAERPLPRLESACHALRTGVASAANAAACVPWVLIG